MIEIKVKKHLSDEIKYVREQVFMLEQGFDQEFDEIDNIASHLTLKIADAIAGTLRIYEDKGCMTIGRVAVLKEYRGNNYGHLMMKKAIEYCKEQGHKMIIVGAQLQAKQFYLSLGFKETDIFYLDEGVPHIKLRYEI